jgi:hypothetical protein
MENWLPISSTPLRVSSATPPSLPQASVAAATAPPREPSQTLTDKDALFRKNMRQTVIGCGGCLGLVVIAFVLVAILGTFGSRSSPPTDNRSQREAVQAYWAPTMQDLGIAAASVGVASDALSNGDSVGAQKALLFGQDEAKHAYDHALNDEPTGDDWSKIQGDLLTAASNYKDTLGKLSQAIDSDSSLDAAQASNMVAGTRANLDEATHMARVWYMAHGGKWSDIEDFDMAQSDATGAFNRLLGKSQ